MKRTMTKTDVDDLIIEAEEGGGRLLPAPPISPHIITTRDELQEMVDYYLSDRCSGFAFDTETLADTKEGRLNTFINEVFWISFATHGRSDAIPLAHPHGRLLRRSRKVKVLPPEELRATLKNGTLSKARVLRVMPDEFAPPPKQLRPIEAFEILRPLFWSNKLKVGQNLKFDIKTVAKYYDNELMPGPYAECSVLVHLLDENRHQYNLESFAKDLLGVTDYPKLGKLGVENFSISAAARYACQDAMYTWLTYWTRVRRLERQNLLGIWALEMDLLPAIMRMEQAGALIDEEAIGALVEELTNEIEDIKGRIFVYNGGREFNLNANADKIKFLFTKKKEGGRGLRPITYTEKTKTPQVTQAVLEHYADKDPAVQLLLDYAEVNKLLSTYAESFRKRMDDAGRLHADFVQFGARTGRLSCREPNLQNIPRADTELGKKVRDLFIAPPGYQLVVADYDQIELRVIAHYSQDPTMVETFMSGADIHGATAELLLDLERGSLKKGDPRRQLGKNINFATSFGAGPTKIAAMCTGAGFPITEDEAKYFLEQFDRRFASVKYLKETIIQTASRRRPVPYVKTIMGRKRRLPELLAVSWKTRGGAERQAVNTVIQGSAADIMKVAMVRTDKRLRGSGCSIVITVHDELVTLAPDRMVAEVKELVLDAMGGVMLRGEPILSVPLVVSCDHAQRWSEAK
jgi:DNA polymerase I-like protein with 3'-5' exonuclease and polymerase domains